MKFKYRFSLVVPTINRVIELEDLFNSFIKQSFKDFEIIVVDQNQDNRLDDIINQFSKTLIINHIRTSKSGASNARNLGIDNAKGEIVTFPDDDCIYPENLLEKVNSVFIQKNNYDGITTNSKDITGDGSVANLSQSSGEINKINIISHLVEFTIFLKVDSIGELRFNTDFGPGSETGQWCDEGPDYLLRLMNKGKKFYYLGNVFIYHPNPLLALNDKLISRSYNYGLARGRYLRIHHYPFWYVLFVWGKYLYGSFRYLFFDYKKFKFYKSGLNGRIVGYLKK